MRIGILTFHCAHNYGAVLQCYALQEFLRQRGHDVRVIDYRPKAITNVYRWFDKKRIIRKNPLRSAIQIILLYWKKKRYEKFEDFINSELQLAPVESIMRNPYDVIIIGSDQVWNYNLTNGFDEYYWGNFPHPSKTRIVSYAASMQDSWPEELNSTICRNLENFDYLSVRESALAVKLMRIYSSRTIYQVADPTLLLQREVWASLAKRHKISKPYLLLFQVEKRDKRTEEIAAKIANKEKLSIVQFLTAVDRKTSKVAMTNSPSEFVGLFMNAAFVVCSSFHGTVFSLIFNRPFVSVRMGVGKDNRVGNLLKTLGLEHHFICKLDKHIDYNYNLDQNKLKALTTLSEAYIKLLEK